MTVTFIVEVFEIII